VTRTATARQSLGPARPERDAGGFRRHRRSRLPGIPDARPVLLATALALALTACAERLIAPRSVRFEANPPGAGEVQVRLRIGAADLRISPAGPAFAPVVRGVTEFNLAAFEPDVIIEGTRVTLTSKGSPARVPTGARAEWDLFLGRTRLLDLELNLGAFEGLVDLGGLRLTRLVLRSGAGDATIRFSEPNPGRLSLLRIEAGASRIRVEDILNAGADRIELDGGAGEFTLEVSGQLREVTRMNVTIAAGSFIAIIPEGIPARVRVIGTLATTTAGEGFDQVQGGYLTSEYEEGSAAVEIEVTAAVGRVELRRR